ncbi:MAG: 4Fe-4S dicluster domain-containing protein [Candidatus Heimdallarchaeota archaeon]|nr:4Fe-4S dicluster domain-containing protein [Candidatus Heimdallarchaeota archaeon]
MNKKKSRKMESAQDPSINPDLGSWKNDIEDLTKVADLMNDQSSTPIILSDELLYALDAIFTSEDINFLLKMGGGKMTEKELRDKVDLSEKNFKKIFKQVLEKGLVVELPNDDGGLVYSIITIAPGWFEISFMDGEMTPEKKLFARRVNVFYRTMMDYGDEEFMNNMIRELGPNHAIYSIEPGFSIEPQTPTTTKKIEVGESLKGPENVVYPTNTILNVFKNLNEEETIGVGTCYCRHQRRLLGDTCQVDMPYETCISLGSAADHLIKYNFAREISKEKAMELVKDLQKKGAVHIVGKTIPIKDLELKLDVDIICNCCWDCCGLFGNYNRGIFPFVLKSFYLAKVAKEEACIGCGTCVDFCPLQSITLNDEGKAQIDESKCCGCGQCAYQCPQNIIEMVPLEREVFLPKLDMSECRIKPEQDPSFVQFKDKEAKESKEDQYDTDRQTLLEVMDEVREKFNEEDAKKAFAGWNKIMQFYFTDLDEYWYFEIVDGVPGPKKQGKVEDPEIQYTMTSGVFVKLMRGELSSAKALRKRLVKVKASIRDLLKMRKIS